MGIFRETRILNIRGYLKEPRLSLCMTPSPVSPSPYQGEGEELKKRGGAPLGHPALGAGAKETVKL